jgi:hypothetical protein
MIITHLNGGLGNQMFQYAAGRAMALRLDVPLKLDIYDLVDRAPKPDFVHRDCDLGLMMTRLDFASLADLGRASEKPRSLLRRAMLRWRRIRLQQSTFREVEQRLVPELLTTRKSPLHLVGYWQDLRYFQDFEGEIRKDFRMRGELHSRFLEPIRNSNSVCINVRRTDFVDLATERETRTECGAEYYQAALSHTLKHTPDARLFGFSDDVEWCLHNLHLQRPVEWIPHSEAGIRFGTYFHLMRNCKHFIIPNSTFAWWAAWLAEAPGKTVVCPSRWYRKATQQPTGLLPNDWHQIDLS